MNGSSNSSAPLRIGVLGGGITGLTAAFYLLRAGHHVTIIEARPEVGGLATYFDFGPFHWDKFYHCILTSDAPLLELINDLDLGAELRWTETKVGFFSDGRLQSMTTSLDLLRFSALSLWQKFRLGLGILRVARIQDGLALEQEPIGPWLESMFGKPVYQKMWAPLLNCKLGNAREQASAAFIWATIRRLYSTREKGASKKERLGYVRGGYRKVFSRLIEKVQQMGGTILTGTPVDQVREEDGHVTVIAGQRELTFDRVISTLPSPALLKIAPGFTPEYRGKLQKVQYMGMVCAVLLVRRKLTPYYCTNLTDNVPFTGIIEMTNLIAAEETQGLHLVYLPKYTSPGDPLFDRSDAEVWKTFLSGLQQVLPDFHEADIVRQFIFRERFVQPIPVIDYSSIVPDMQTPVQGLLLANTTQIVNSTLNNNEMVKIARRAVLLATQDHSSHDRRHCATAMLAHVPLPTGKQVDVQVTE